MQTNSRFKRWLTALMRPIRRGIHNYLVPVTDSKEFKGLYPFLVMSLGVLAAFPVGSARNLVISLAFGGFVFAAMLLMVFEARRIPLNCKWHILFVSYYRPFLYTLTHKVVRPVDGNDRLDVLTYRIGDFVRAVEEAAIDFKQVSGSCLVHLVSFDIEYVPLLKKGLVVSGAELKLIPLSDFWINEEMQDFPSRIPREVSQEILGRIDRDKLFALPIGWGLVGVAIIDDQLTSSSVYEYIAQASLAEDSPLAFCFDKLIENYQKLEEMGYEVLCFDFWNGVGQLAALYCTGHMNLVESEHNRVADLYRKLFRILKRENILSEPQSIIDRARRRNKTIIIGGSTWTGLKGDLLPIAVPHSKPAYGAFCECFGVLSAPEKKTTSAWDRDACGLVNWLVENLCDRTSINDSVAGVGNSIVNNYLPGMYHGTTRKPGNSRKRLTELNPMKWDSKAKVVFRQFPSDNIESVTKLRDLWYAAKTV